MDAHEKEMEILSKLRNLFLVPPLPTEEAAAGQEEEQEEEVELVCPSAPSSPPRQLDTQWMDRFSHQEQEYRYFYKEPVYFISLRFLFVNRDNLLEKTVSEYFTLQQPGIVSREEMLSLLKRARFDADTGKHYSLLSLWQYNITIDPRQLHAFLANKLSSDQTDFFRIIKHFDSISFAPTIESFNDMNELIFVLYEKILVSTSSSSPSFHASNHSSTKKIIIENRAARKTRRKLFK